MTLNILLLKRMKQLRSKFISLNIYYLIAIYEQVLFFITVKRNTVVASHSPKLTS